MSYLIGAFVTIALVLGAFAVRSRWRGGSTPCPTCGGRTRVHEPYLMCDECKNLVGVVIDGHAYTHRKQY